MTRRFLDAALVVLAVAGCGSSIGSIGAVLGRDNNTRALHVRDVSPGLAADRAGLIPGDEIVMIDGTYVRDLSEKDIRERLRGDIGSTVDLTVARGSEVRRVRVTRGEMRVHEAIKPQEEKIDP